jgi:hypothetical protein
MNKRQFCAAFIKKVHAENRRIMAVLSVQVRDSTQKTFSQFVIKRIDFLVNL